MGLKVFLNDLAGTKLWDAFWGAQWNALLCGTVSGSMGSFRPVFLATEHQPNFVHFFKTISVAPADPRELLPHCCCLRSNPRLFPTRPSFFEVVGCLVSSARVDGFCRAPFGRIKKNQTKTYRTPIEPNETSQNRTRKKEETTLHSSLHG